MITLVEEDSKHEGGSQEKNDNKEKGNKLVFSDRVTTLDTNKYPFLRGRPVTKIEFAPYQPDVFVSSHGCSHSGTKEKSNGSVLDDYSFLWDT